MTFGERLIQLRKERGFRSRVAFADELGIPSTTLRNYETNVREPSHAFLCRIANMFNVSLDYLLGLTNTPRMLNTPPHTLTFEELSLIEAWRNLDETSREIVQFAIEKEASRRR